MQELSDYLKFSLIQILFHQSYFYSQDLMTIDQNLSVEPSITELKMKMKENFTYEHISLLPTVNLLITPEYYE